MKIDKDKIIKSNPLMTKTQLSDINYNVVYILILIIILISLIT